MRLVALLFSVLFAGSLQAGFAFVPGHYYTTTWFSSVISEWDRQGNLVGTLTLPSSLATDLRGTVFGPDGLLYVVAGIVPTPYRVIAIDSSGQVMQTYPLDNEILGNTGYGKIAIGRGGQIFVAGGGHVCRFQIGDPSSATSLFSGTNTYDIKATPGGTLLAAESYQIRETGPDGGVYNTFDGQGTFSNVRGIAFHFRTFKIFVNDLGDSGFPFHVGRYDYVTDMLETSISRNYPDGLLIDEDGNLLIGSGTLPPILVTRDFALLQTFGVSPQQFVAQCPSTPSLISISSEFLTVFQNQVRLRWLDRSLRTWTLQYCEDLAAGQWQTIGNAQSDFDGFIDVNDYPGTLVLKRFYRLVPYVNPPPPPRPGPLGPADRRKGL